MPTKMRLQRRGKKQNAFYHIVIADSRAPRDGRFIENIGTYNPNTNPASIDLKFEKALDWIKSGAEPTETVKAILSYEGVLYRNHLDKGVMKGAFDEAQAQKRFDEWKKDKLNKIQQKIDGLTKTKTEAEKAALKAEDEYNKKREQEIIAKTSALAEEASRIANQNEAGATSETEAPTEVEAATEAETTVETPVEVEAATEVAPEAEAAVESAPEVVAETTEEVAAPEATASEEKTTEEGETEEKA